MKRLQITALLLALCLLLSRSNLSARAANAESPAFTTLCGKTMLVLGDSYTAGFGLWGGSHGWTDLVSEALGMTQLNYSISGSSFAGGPRGSDPMVERCLELPTSPAPDIILLQGGSNDHVRDIPLGDLSERNAESFLGALNLILDHLEKTYPAAQIICFTPWISNGSRNGLSLTAADYVQAMKELCGTRDIRCYDASQAEENGMHMEEQAFRARFCLSSADYYHLNPAGHRRFAPVMAEYLSQTLTGAPAADRFADLQIAGDSLRQGAALVTAAGLMQARDRLFAPTRSAVWADLAHALYTLAGEPPVTAYDIAGLTRDTPEHQAACYMIQWALLPGPEDYLSEQSLTRETLATALYCYYTDLCGQVVTKYVGLGPYPDGDDVSESANLPMGWALSAGLMEEKDGMLRPRSAVSRGELAVTLSAFLRLLGEVS